MNQDPLKDKISELVKGAEGVLTNHRGGKVNRTQFSQLVSVAQTASCAEEVVNYLHYQVGREIWDPDLAENTINKVDEVTHGLEPATKLKAWQRFALYLYRAQKYREYLDKKGGRRG